MNYELFHNNNFSLVAKFNEEAFDYYSFITLELIHNETTTEIFCDNLLYLYNIVRHYRKDGIPVIPDNIDIHSLGIKINDYFSYIDKEKNHIDTPNLHIYCADCSCNMAKLFFQKNNNYYFGVTPIFEMNYDDGNEDEDDSKYEAEFKNQYTNFLNNYSVVFYSIISTAELNLLANKIERLYAKLLCSNDPQ